MKREGVASYVKLSCSVPMSGLSGYLLINLSGERADLWDGNNNYEPSQKQKTALTHKEKITYRYTFHFPVCKFSGKTAL